MTFSARMRKALVHDKRVNKEALNLIEEKAGEDWTRNPDVLEGFFWEILHKGVNGGCGARSMPPFTDAYCLSTLQYIRGGEGSVLRRREVI